jgi:N-dimethylarginine dimethylaminohydrolase
MRTTMREPLPVEHAVLMGDPTHFSIRGGANPHTRGRWGWRKHVDRSQAIAQWHSLARALETHGVAVFVIPPEPKCPGLVYPANAGALLPGDAGDACRRRCFYLSNLLPSRAAERPLYAEFIATLGIPTGSLQARFEGEADFFPAGGRYLFTYGHLERQRFVPRFGIPPYRRVYGFRTEIAALAELAAFVPDVDIIPLELIDEAFYHGDTVLCAFGPRRRFLLACLDALAESARRRLRTLFGDDLVPLGREDAARYAANSFSLVRTDGAWLFMPAGVTTELQAEVRARGVEPVLVEVSEFLRKGGGSVKCMIGDLGPWPGGEVDSGVSDAVRAFRCARRYPALFGGRDRPAGG